MSCCARVIVCACLCWSQATPFHSRERDRLGKEGVNLANKYLIKITKRICVLLHDIAMIHVRLDHMLADVNAVHQVRAVLCCLSRVVCV
jgi:hypothetical protein